jgi:hypothetical protein
MGDFTAVLKAEITDLETDIRERPDPRVRKLQRLRETLAEYEPPPQSNSRPSVPQTNGNGTVLEPLPAASGLVAMSKSSRMILEITKLLRQRETVHRKELLDHLIAHGIMGKEKDPMQALAIFLSSHRDQFGFDGAGNYSLRRA